MHRNHLYPKKSLSCTLLKPGRVFREVKCYYVLTSYLCFRPSPEPDNCNLVCQHGAGGGIQIKLVKTDWHSLCSRLVLCCLGCTACASYLLKALPVGCWSPQTVDLSLKRGGEYISGNYMARKGGVKTNILSREADFFPFSVAYTVPAALRWYVFY